MGGGGGGHQIVMLFLPPVVHGLLKKAYKRGGDRHPMTPLAKLLSDLKLLLHLFYNKLILYQRGIY